MSRPASLAFGLFLALAPLCAAAELELLATFGSASFRHADSVLALDVAPDGRVVSGGKDGFVRVWAADGRELHVHAGHRGWVTAVRWLDAGRCASAGWDGVVRVWGAEGPAVELAGHKDWVLSLAYANGVLASAGRDQQVKVWDLAQKRALRTRPGTAVALSPDGTHLAAVSTSGVEIEPVAAPKKKSKAPRAPAIPLHVGGTPAVRFLPGGARLATGGADGEVAVWDVATAAPIFRHASHRGMVSALDVSADGARIVSSGSDSAVVTLDGAGKVIERAGPLAAIVHAVALRPGQRALCGFEDGAIADTARVSPTGPGAVAALAVSPDGKRLAVAGGTHLTDLIDLDGKRVAQCASDDRVEAVAFAGAGTLAAGGQDAAITLFDAATGKRLRKLVAHTPWVTALAAAPDGATLVSGAGSATLKHWSLDGRELATLHGHRAQVNGVAWLAGERVLSGARDRAVGLWSLADKKALATLKGHASAVQALAASVDGTAALTGGENGELLFWEPPREDPAGRSTVHGAHAVSAVAMTADGARAVSADRAGLVVVHATNDRAELARTDLTAQGDHARAIVHLTGGRFAIGTARGLVRIYRVR